MSYFRRLGRMLLYLLAVGYLALVLVGLFLSDRLIFQPRHSSYKDSSEVIKLKTVDGKTISAIYFPNQSAKFTILYSHGNAEDIGDLRPWLETLHASGFAVFAYDYHGYGTSEGVPSEKNVYADVDAAYDYLTNALHVPPGKIISFGRSVGNGASIDLAARRPVGGLVVQSGFASAFVVLTRVPLVPFDRFRNVSKIKNVRCPVLVIHGRNDHLIPFRNGKRLFEAAPMAKESYWVEKAGHNDLEWVAGEELLQRVKRFSEQLP